MKKLCLIATLSALLTIAAAPALALGPVDLGVDLDVYNKYVWRGMVANPEAVLQTDLTASIFGIGLGFWGNVDMTDINDNAWKYTEFNYTAQYGLSFPFLEFGFGLIHYTFPNMSINSTTEVFGTAKANVLLAPTLSYYYDFEEVDGGYISLGATYSSQLSPSIDLEVGATLGAGSQGWHASYFSLSGITATGTEMTDFLFQVSAPIKPVPLLSITPSIAYSTLLSKAKTDHQAAGVDTDAFVFGLGAGFKF